MRIFVTFNSNKEIPEREFNKYSFQSAIYSSLLNTNFKEYHNKYGFKYFCFSDFFPPGNLILNYNKSIIISSPNSELIKTIYENLEKTRYIYLSNSVLEIKDIRIIRIRNLPNTFITGSPIVLYENNKQNKYFSFRDGGEVKYFLDRIKENALKKFKQYYNLDNFSFDEEIFDEIIFKDEVAVNVYKGGNTLLFIGSIWKKLHKVNIKPKYTKFYRFIMESGIGEKNSLGFGFLNPLWSDKNE